MPSIENMEQYIALRDERDKLKDEIETMRSQVESLTGENGGLSKDVNKLRKIIADNVISKEPTKEEPRGPIGIRELILEQIKEEE